MVGLVSNTHLKSSENTPKKMSDSVEPVEENIDAGNLQPDLVATGDSKSKTSLDDTPEKAETSSDNAADVSKEKPDNEEPAEKMDVDEEPSVLTGSDDTNKDKANDDKPVRSKSRSSSRSGSTNSSTSAPISQSLETNQTNKNKTTKQALNSEEEDFFGFDDLDPKTESETDQSKKSSRNIQPDLVATGDSKSKTSLDDTPEKAETSSVDLDSNSGLDTPSTSSRKGGSRGGNKKSLSIDLSNPGFLKPFEYGWVRELVYRSTTDSSLRRNADIYYYTPTGKKVRSSREILEHLTGDLTIDNFTFFKEAIGVDDPSKEIIREAKAKPGPRGLEDGTPQPVKKTTPKIKVQNVTPKESTKTITPKVVFKGHVTPKGRPSSGKSKLDKKRKSSGPDDVDVMVESEDWSPEAPKVNIQTSDNQCSIKCRLALGLIPSLQCGTCVCLYHPACMGVSQEKLNKPSFVFKCKNCKSKQSKVEAARDQAPLPAAKENSAIAPSTLKISSPQPSLPMAPLNSARPGIVGAVTTWFSPSSSIQQGNDAPEVDENAPGIYVNPHGSTFVGFSRNTVVNVNTQEPLEVNTVTNSTGLYLIPCDPQQLNGPQSIPLANGLKRPLDSPNEKEISPPEKKNKLDTKAAEQTEGKPAAVPKVIKTGKYKLPPYGFMGNLNAGFVALLQAFQHLRVHELLRAGHVSKMWQFVASHHSLWETVRMKNSRVSDWKGFGRTLSSRGTRALDLKKMLVPESLEEQSKMWEELCDAVKTIKTLTKIDMGRCSPAAFLSMAESAPQLESLVSLAIKGNEIDLQPLSKCPNLKELRVKAVTGALEIRDLSCLSNLQHLSTLTLTTIKNLNGIELYLPPNLEVLELGECSQLSPDLALNALPKMTKLKRLRLEKGQGDCPTIALLEAVSHLPQVVQLELINFDIKPGFDKALAKCTNLRTLLIIPTYVTQSATTNHVVMGGVSKLSNTLHYFIWGLTLELLKVTDLFIGQVENQKTGKMGPPPKKGLGDSIPILKPSSAEGDLKEGGAPSQVDILALTNLQRVLSTLLPTTKIKILKVPFSATWRQTVTDG